MSGHPGPQEYSHLKVLHDFQYKTAEGREIIIKKNERLYLLQKTNADWWQVVRNFEQRSFYVPATYVRELSKASASSSSRKNSEEERDNIFEPPQDPSYKSMPRESSNAMRNVKKWLAGAIETKPESPKTLYGSPETYQNHPDDNSRPHSSLRTIDHKTKSLERELRSGHASDRDDVASNGSPRLRDCPETVENSRRLNRLSTSPKGAGLQFRMEAALQDPFRRELESSLDRRNLGVKGSQIRARSSNSESSHINSSSEGVDHKDQNMMEKSEREFDSRKLNLSVHEEPRRDSESSSGTSRNSRSLDFEGGSKFSLRRERSVSPKPIYSRQMTVAGSAAGTTAERPTSGDHKILNDKRRTWAVEELMSELTQMCKERVVNKKPAFQLKSTEIKANFDPLEKLTREIHEMNRLRAKGNVPDSEDSVNSNSSRLSPINVCKIAINTENSLKSPESPINTRINEEESPVMMKDARKRCPSVSHSEGDASRPLKSPKSPKILDEYNEANILNDCRSLSPDKAYQRRFDSVSPSQESGEELPCYSNVRLSAEKGKTRPKLRIKVMDTSAELKLTPSLEKLASEIQFLPARRTSRSGEEQSSSASRVIAGEAFEDASKSDESLERPPILKPRLAYKGSFKAPAERNKSIGLKKNASLHCATIPECYRRFRRNDAENWPENSSFKRRSRSLSDLEHLGQIFETRDDKETPVLPKGKPVPLPRTKIFAVKTIPEHRKHENSPSKGFEHASPTFHSLSDRFNHQLETTIRRNIESSTAVGFKTLLCASDSGSDNCLQSKELLSSSTGNLNDSGQFRGTRKSTSNANFNERNKAPRESLSDEQILSSNASSEALHSQSESEITATADISSQPSPLARSHQEGGFECTPIDLPFGWEQKYDSDTGQICFLNQHGDKWFSSNDAEGKIYFFEENSNESSWVLPSVNLEKSPSMGAERKSNKIDVNGSSSTPSEHKDSANIRTSLIANTSIVGREPSKKSGPTVGDWPHLCDGNNMRFLKEGIINRTKITENGKKLRKNWSTSYAVLTELFLLFFKDAKTFTMMKSGQSSVAKPDISVDLNGALVEHGERASSRKNVYMISTVLGLQVLIQSDNTSVATEWFQEVHGAIRKLPSGFKSQGKLPLIGPELRINSGNKQQNAETNQSEDSKRFSKITRSRSMKMKRLDDSLEDLSGSPAERQTKIKAKLRRFFLRRPAVELLVKNGIYKDEPAFGSYLSDVCPPEAPRVPLFVKSCIEVLEGKEENMKTDGLYRASGNLSQIQKIRLQVDQYKLDVLAQEEDVHVLAGALKLFFRELKEPLIPSSFFKEAVNASMLKKHSAKIQCFRDIVKALPAPNYDTLQFLLKHLLRVTSYQEFNRMHIPNLAIVFGPTLMWPAEESANMALDFMQQNLVIECLLSEYNKIFK